jgi:hypothetical protein
VVLLAFVFRGYTAADSKPPLSKALIAGAKTKADHERLAEYYNSEVVRPQAEAADYDEAAEM